MILGPDRIPDGIEPLSGYRMWRYVLTTRRAWLHSMTCAGLGGCPWEQAGTDWVESHCMVNDHPWHVSPSEGCSCGVYAVSSPAKLYEDGLPFEGGDGSGFLMGRVDLAGKVIEHDWGYRAERARIAQLIPIEGAIRDVMRFGSRLGVSIAPAVPPPSTDTWLSDVMVRFLRRLAESMADPRNEAEDRLRRSLQGLSTYDPARVGAYPRLSLS
jgi:hypothetical protein